MTTTTRGRAGLGGGPQPFELGDDRGGHVGGAEVGCGRVDGYRERGEIDERVDPRSHGVGRLGGSRPPRRRAALDQEVVHPVADRRAVVDHHHGHAGQVAGPRGLGQVDDRRHVADER